ncbi:MAG: hypothetical protein IGNPGNKH_00693 [Sodalis sp. Ffu]|nr:MAG: hypothetical protein IGNPGNKH_00693 [Sodalis sp. Ffu]
MLAIDRGGVLVWVMWPAPLCHLSLANFSVYIKSFSFRNAVLLSNFFSRSDDDFTTMLRGEREQNLLSHKRLYPGVDVGDIK